MAICSQSRSSKPLSRTLASEFALDGQEKEQLGRHERRRKQKEPSRDENHLARTQELEAERAAAAMVELCFGTPQAPPIEEPVTEVVHPPPPKRRRGINETRRRCAIHELYVNMGEPDASKWRGRGGTVSEIRDALRLPAGADRCVHAVLQRIADAADNEDFDGGRR